jgi:hypothetical protein
LCFGIWRSWFCGAIEQQSVVFTAKKPLFFIRRYPGIHDLKVHALIITTLRYQQNDNRGFAPQVIFLTGALPVKNITKKTSLFLICHYPSNTIYPEEI